MNYTSRRAHVISRYSCARYDRRRTMISGFLLGGKRRIANTIFELIPGRPERPRPEPVVGRLKDFFRHLCSFLSPASPNMFRFRFWPVFSVRLPLDFPEPVTSRNRAFWNTLRGLSVSQHHLNVTPTWTRHKIIICKYRCEYISLRSIPHAADEAMDRLKLIFPDSLTLLRRRLVQPPMSRG